MANGAIACLVAPLNLSRLVGATRAGSSEGLIKEAVEVVEGLVVEDVGHAVMRVEMLERCCLKLFLLLNSMSFASG